MPVRRITAAGLLAVGATLAVPAAPASAHGAPTTPISRSAACAGNGTKPNAAACKAAKKATDGFLGAFDNIRIANVNGDDEKFVPDGKLCSAGLDLYRGLDLVRDDWPSTSVKSGQKLSVSYEGTIPHEGTFRLYLTKASWDAEKKLTWDALGSKPLASITDPPLTGGAYRMKVTLPERTGHQILYVVWQTSSTPDTYYSCSDLIFPAAAASPSPSRSTRSSATHSVAASSAAPVRATVAATVAEPVESAEPAVLAASDSGSSPITIGHWMIAGALGVGALAAAAAGLGRFRRRRNSL
ncbi:lytic polysaccharide monooxygenase [Actinoplanes sp. NPDC051851]|uniref:lytic polysaccharide monooxygenase n=1 Tax=Actinoplanes sp. NPDC051851 TaxID=3154753 RepID=UPI00343F0DC7